MRIAIAGGGPGGLYLSILLKRLDPAHEVVVHERNAPDDTFGFGVVFSDETLGGVRGRRPGDLREITRRSSCAGARSTSTTGRGGHLRRARLLGDGRKELLGILQRRAAALGVELRFQLARSPSSTPTSWSRADGVNSTRALAARASSRRWTARRATYSGSAPSTSSRPSRSSSPRREHGVFQVHAYPYGDAMSTFIVETTRRPGGARARPQPGPSDEGIALRGAVRRG